MNSFLKAKITVKDFKQPNFFAFLFNFFCLTYLKVSFYKGFGEMLKM